MKPLVAASTNRHLIKMVRILFSAKDNVSTGKAKVSRSIVCAHNGYNEMFVELISAGANGDKRPAGIAALRSIAIPA